MDTSRRSAVYRLWSNWRVKTMCFSFISAILLIVLWLLFASQPRLIYSPESHFELAFSADDMTSLGQTLMVLTAALDAAHVTYFMTSGTLLGSYRHHGPIPWDDDVDLMVSSADKALVWNTLSALMPKYGLFLSGTIDSPYHWKFYPRYGGRWVPFRPFRWPYIDLLFYHENETHVWNGSPNLPDERWLRNTVFPLRRRPYASLMLPAPCDPAAVLNVNFNDFYTDCRSRVFSHAFDLPLFVSAVSMPCLQLSHRFPFVQRPAVLATSVKPQNITETLLLGDSPIERRTVLTGC